MSQRPKRPKLLLQHRKDLEREKKNRRANKKNAEDRLTEKSDVSLSQVEKKPRRKQATESVLVEGTGSNTRRQCRQKHTDFSQNRSSVEKNISSSHHDRQRIYETARPQPTDSVPLKNKVSIAHYCRKREGEKQRWTELTAVGQMLSDEVHMYLNTKEEGNEQAVQDITSGERRQLTTWSNSVSKQIYRKNSVILDNVRLVSNLKKATNQVKLRRDDLMVSRTQTKYVREETDRLRKETDKAHKEIVAKKGASRFLSALQNLAEPYPRHPKRKSSIEN